MKIDSNDLREPHVNKNAKRMKRAATKHKRPRPYQMHGDSYRQRLLKQRGVHAIDGRTLAGKQARAWRLFALSRKGGKECTIDVKAKIEAGTFYLWRALELRAWIVADARTRGTPINRRRGTLPAINTQYDTAMEQWQKINDALELDKTLDLARRLQLERLQQATGGKR
jgi:hypothetical protein